MTGIRRGSYTIEAAIVMGIVMMLLYAFVFIGFYLHDRLVLYESGLNYAETLLHMTEEPVTFSGKLEIVRLEEQNILRIGGYQDAVNTAFLQELFLYETGQRLFLSQPDDVKIEADGTEVRLFYSAQVRIPFGSMVRKMIGVQPEISREIRMRRRIDPEEVVRLMRGVIWRDR